MKVLTQGPLDTPVQTLTEKKKKNGLYTRHLEKCNKTSRTAEFSWPEGRWKAAGSMYRRGLHRCAHGYSLPMFLSLSMHNLSLILSGHLTNILHSYCVIPVFEEFIF